MPISRNYFTYSYGIQLNCCGNTKALKPFQEILDVFRNFVEIDDSNTSLIQISGDGPIGSKDQEISDFVQLWIQKYFEPILHTLVNGENLRIVSPIRISCYEFTKASNKFKPALNSFAVSMCISLPWFYKSESFVDLTIFTEFKKQVPVFTLYAKSFNINIKGYSFDELFKEFLDQLGCGNCIVTSSLEEIDSHRRLEFIDTRLVLKGNQFFYKIDPSIAAKLGFKKEEDLEIFTTKALIKSNQTMDEMSLILALKALDFVCIFRKTNSLIQEIEVSPDFKSLVKVFFVLKNDMITAKISFSIKTWINEKESRTKAKILHAINSGHKNIRFISTTVVEIDVVSESSDKLDSYF
ncbi:MAG: hypothetical protein ACRCXZ_05730 [Patescibacteria group bacterium]